MSIAREYIIQRIGPGEEASGWQTLGYVPVADYSSPDYGYGLGEETVEETGT